MSMPRLLFAAAAVATVLAGTNASARDDEAGYLVTADGQPVHDSFGDCWHTREWVRGMRYASCEPKPAVAAAAPLKLPPAPVPKRSVAAAKPAPKPQAPLRLSADTLFGFDSVALSAQGRSALDALQKRIGDADYRLVEVAGHADRLGTPSYNRRLSQRRAEVIRDYLVQHGIDAKRVRTEGLGSAQAESASAQCQGLPRARLIDCLQPERYADITVLGTMHTAAAQ